VSKPKKHAEFEAAWRVAAHEVGGEYGVVQGWNLPWIQVRDPAGIIAVEAIRSDAGSMTRARALFHADERLTLSVSDEGIVSGFFKKLGFVQDVEIGHDGFDPRFVAKGFPANRVRELLAPPVADLLVRQPFVDLRVSSSATSFTLPPGVAEIRLRRSKIVKNPRQLVGMVEIIRALLPRLDPVGDRRWSDEERLIARLSRSGGGVADPWHQTVLWEGDPPRREAARLLGEIRSTEAVMPLIAALDDTDETLVAEAIAALARIGDVRSIPSLIGRLSDRGRSVDGASIAERAGDALERLGEGALVAAMDRALQGDAAGLAEAVAHRRQRAVDTLMQVLDSFDLDARVHAATALGALGAREALDLLRDKTRAMGLRTRMTEAARTAIAEIESRANLPRPADGPGEGVDTLPRPAG
jgi:hypothetical protein